MCRDLGKWWTGELTTAPLLQDALIVEHMLWRLFHIEDDIGAAREKIVDAQEKLEDLESAQVSEIQVIFAHSLLI